MGVFYKISCDCGDHHITNTGRTKGTRTETKETRSHAFGRDGQWMKVDVLFWI